MVSKNIFLRITLNSLLGGIAIALISLLSFYVNPLFGSILWAYPFTVVPSILFLKENGKKYKFISNFLLDTSFGIILLGISILALYYFTKNESDSVSVWVPIGKASVVYVVSSIFYYFVVKLFGWNQYFM